MRKITHQGEEYRMTPSQKRELQLIVFLTLSKVPYQLMRSLRWHFARDSSFVHHLSSVWVGGLYDCVLFGPCRKSVHHGVTLLYPCALHVALIVWLCSSWPMPEECTSWRYFALPLRFARGMPPGRYFTLALYLHVAYASRSSTKPWAMTCTTRATTSGSWPRLCLKNDGLVKFVLGWRIMSFLSLFFGGENMPFFKIDCDTKSPHHNLCLPFAPHVL